MEDGKQIILKLAVECLALPIGHMTFKQGTVPKNYVTVFPWKCDFPKSEIPRKKKNKNIFHIFACSFGTCSNQQLEN